MSDLFVSSGSNGKNIGTTS